MRTQTHARTHAHTRAETNTNAYEHPLVLVKNWKQPLPDLSGTLSRHLQFLHCKTSTCFVLVFIMCYVMYHKAL